MKTGTIRWSLLIFGILLAGLGLVMFATPGINSLVIAYLVCTLMLVYGIAEVVFYIAHRKSSVVSGWLLADGIITSILGVLLMFMPGAQILSMSILFALWVLFTGVTRTSAAFVAKDAGVSSWGWVLIAGIVGILVGIWLMFDPLFAVMTIGYLLPVAFFVQGVSAVAAFFATGTK